VVITLMACSPHSLSGRTRDDLPTKADTAGYGKYPDTLLGKLQFYH